MRSETPDPDQPVVAAPAAGPRSALRSVLASWPGRAVLAGATVKLAAVAVTNAIGDYFAVDVLGTAGTLALLVGLIAFLVRAVRLAKRRLLWRVRRKLILSYIFVGLVPALLIIIFCLLCGLLLFGTVSQYIVETRLRAGVDQAEFLAHSTAMEIGRLRSDEDVEAFLEGKQRLLAERNPGASMAVIPVGRSCEQIGPAVPVGRLQPSRPMVAGPWPHVEPPSTLPEWVPCSGFGGLIAYTLDDPEGMPASGVRTAAIPTYLAVRAVSLGEGTSPHFAVVLDLPVNEQAVDRLRRDTGIELRGIAATSRNGAAPVPARAGAKAVHFADDAAGRPYEPPWVVFTDFVDWASGRHGRATLAIAMSIGGIYDRLTPWRLGTGAMSFGQVVLLLVVVVGAAFLIIQFVALVVGLALAKSITGSVHELFVGTVRVQQGDFSHRIAVKARDQLGELADSFNTMTSRLSGLLAQMAEKKRLEEELRIARNIQMSLLPQGPVRMPGLEMTANCTPAREVGGDYYDFFPLGDTRIGILIADVSGKGTSAALYMAEMKGLMLSLSQIHRSPRDLLVAADRIIADNLDNRSFITMTYAVVDLERRVMTYARAGHTPLIHLPADGATRRAEVLTPGGMVLGLKLDKGEKFAECLEEASVPLETGDLFVFFTDGITEAMNASEELFGEGRLGALIEEHADLPFEELRERILREVRAFAGEAGPHDDMTLILLRVDDAAVPAGAGAAVVAVTVP
jgi:sigma-B regulation protein RsbU (phosphoserine phosphatase)